jgi:copper resistance protein C
LHPASAKHVVAVAEEHTLFAALSRRTSLILIVLLIAGATQVCWAHAILKEATPAANSTVKSGDLAINLRFNVRIDGTRSRLHLVTAAGTSLALKITGQATPDTLQSHATGLGPGVYILVWNVLASDGHMSKGEIPFTVN